MEIKWDKVSSVYTLKFYINKGIPCISEIEKKNILKKKDRWEDKRIKESHRSS